MLVLVVGPSGAGKDSLLKAAREEFRGDPRIGFARRVITRPADPDGRIMSRLRRQSLKRGSSRWRGRRMGCGMGSRLRR